MATSHSPQLSQTLSVPPTTQYSSSPSQARLRKRFARVSSSSLNGTTSSSKNHVNNLPSRARLTANQKSDNHKEAENRRRNGIRDQYIALSHLVPNTEGQAKSEEKMLVKTAEYMRQLLEDRRLLTQQLRKSGGNVVGLQLADTEWGESEWEPKCEREYLKKRAERIAEQGYDEADDCGYDKAGSSS